MLGSSSEAGTILIFGQANPLDVVTLHNGGAGTSTLSTAGNADGAGVSIPVLITTFLGVPGLSIPAFETYVGVASSGAAVTMFGLDAQAFQGTVEITSLPGGAGTNFLTATFANVGTNVNTLSGTAGANSASLVASQPPASLAITSDFGTFIAPTGMSISYSNVTPPLTIFNSSLGASGDTTMQSAGNFSATTIPEPSGLLLGCIASVGMVGFGYGLRRRKAKGAGAHTLNHKA